jgi:hypothetical protein
LASVRHPVFDHPPTTAHAPHTSRVLTKCRIAVGGFASVYKGKYLGEPVAIKELRSAELDPTFSDQGGINRSDESRRLTYEEFRHEVWIMRCAGRVSRVVCGVCAWVRGCVRGGCHVFCGASLRCCTR